MLRREGADPLISESFYCTVVQAVLLFGSETLLLMAEMLQKLEGLHVSFIWQVTNMEA